MFTFMFAWKITVLFGYMNRQHESYEVGWDIWKYKTGVSCRYIGLYKNLGLVHEGLNWQQNQWSKPYMHPEESSENMCDVRKYWPSFIMGVYEKFFF